MTVRETWPCNALFSYSELITPLTRPTSYPLLTCSITLLDLSRRCCRRNISTSLIFCVNMMLPRWSKPVSNLCHIFNVMRPMHLAWDFLMIYAQWLWHVLPIYIFCSWKLKGCRCRKEICRIFSSRTGQLNSLVGSNVWVRGLFQETWLVCDYFCRVIGWTNMCSDCCRSHMLNWINHGAFLNLNWSTWEREWCIIFKKTFLLRKKKHI